MKESKSWLIASLVFGLFGFLAIILETMEITTLLPLQIELTGTTLGVGFGFSITQFARSSFEEESEEKIRSRLLKELTRLALGQSIIRNKHYYTPVWDSIVSNGKDDLLDDAFLEAVFEVYDNIDYLNQRMIRQTVHEWEAYPLLEKILKLLEESEVKVQIDSVKKRLGQLDEMTPAHAKKKD